MLKFKHLFPNRDLATMLASNWYYDASEIEAVKFFRASSNSVWIFKQNGLLCFLRFAPVEEKQSKIVLAELDFLRYLRNNEYPAAETILTRDKREVAIEDTPWGRYVAVVFKETPGQRFDRVDYSHDLYYGCGKMLGWLHNLSENYTPENPRPDWQQNLQWVKEVLRDYNAPDKALKEVSILEEFFFRLPKTPDNFGLVHYDFEPDNIFYNESTSRYGIIDFDDSMYHWFILDIDQYIESIKDDLPVQLHEKAANSFLCGYSSVKSIEDSMFKLTPLFRRYVHLFDYTRCLRSVYEKWNNEPEWMTGLRENLMSIMNSRSRCFGDEISRTK